MTISQAPAPRSQSNDELMLNLIRRSCIGDISTRGAQHFGNRIALIDGDHTVTYRELDARANSVATGLLSTGLSHGDRLAVLAPNSWQFVVTFFACAKTGIIFMPINLALSSDEIAFQLSDSCAKAVVVAGQYLEKTVTAAAQVAHSTRLFVIGEVPGTFDTADPMCWENLLEHDRAPVEVLVEDIDIVHCLYTSGTTSSPKAVTTGHNAVLIAALSTAIQMRHQRDASGSVMAIALPMFHVTGLDALLLPLLVTGGTALLYPAFDARTIADAIGQHAITHLVLLPMMWEALLARVAQHDTCTDSVRLGLYAMAPMALDRVDAVRAAFPNADIVLASGQTETTPASEMQWPAHQRTKHGAWGSPAATTDVRIMGADGALLAPGHRGEIVYRTPQLMTEYRGNPDATGTAFAHGWFHSGDLGHIDEDGVVWFTDRVKDIVKSGGENVSSIEVEQVISRCPGVLETAVVGRTHERWGEAVTAIVVIDGLSALTELEIIDHCRRHLAGYKVPKEVIFADALPRTATGKIEKHRLRN